MLRRVEEGPEINVEDNLGMNEMPDSGCKQTLHLEISSSFTFCHQLTCHFLPQFPPGLRVVFSY